MNLLENLFESIYEGIVVTDENGVIILMNKPAKKLLQLKKEVLNQPVYDYVHIYDESGIPLPYTTLSSYKSNRCELETATGHSHYINLHIKDLNKEDGSLYGKVISFFEINEERKREEEILYLTYHDVLTGLYNRVYFEEQLKQYDTERQYPLSVILGDVNGLKLTNDVFGHSAGDRLLKRIARVLKSTCRHEDMISRWGGDEFIILLPHTSENQVHIIMNRIMVAIDNMYLEKDISSILPSLSLGYGVKERSEQDIYSIIKTAENNMYRRKMLTSSSIYSSIVSSMTKALYERSSETEEHANRLYELCAKIAEKFNLPNAKLNELELFARLHDIGKIGIPDDILNKPGPLTKDEWQIMRQHPEIGYRIANSTEELKPIANYILSHHEWYNGEGYPKGISGTEIPLLSRILSVVDAYDAMTSNRPYRKAMKEQDAIDEINNHVGTQFDPKVVQLFNDLMKK